VEMERRSLTGGKDMKVSGTIFGRRVSCQRDWTAER
jgi:hypothetical protein